MGDEWKRSLMSCEKIRKIQVKNVKMSNLSLFFFLHVHCSLLKVVVCSHFELTIKKNCCNISVVHLCLNPLVLLSRVSLRCCVRFGWLLVLCWLLLLFDFTFLIDWLVGELSTCWCCVKCWCDKRLWQLWWNCDGSMVGACWEVMFMNWCKFWWMTKVLHNVCVLALDNLCFADC